MSLQNVPLNEEATNKKDGYISPTDIDFMSESSRAPTAWIMSRGSTLQLSAYKDCKVVMLPQTFLPMPMSFAYPKNSSLALIVNHMFWKFKETGGYKRIHNKYKPLDPDCRQSFKNSCTMF